MLAVGLILLPPASWAALKVSNAVSGSYNAGTSWVGGVAPTTSDTVQIVSGANITNNSATSVAGIVVDAGGILTVSSTLTCNHGTNPSADWLVNGAVHNTGGANTVALGAAANMIIANGGSYTNASSGSGTANVGTGASITFQSGSTYVNNKNGGTVPTCTFQPGSKAIFIGNVTSAPAVQTAGQTFATVIWNSTQTAAIGLAAVFDTTIFEDLIVQNTGGFEVRLGSTQTGSLNVGRNLVVTNGSLSLSSSTGVRTMFVSNNVTVGAGGTLTVTTAGNGSVIFAKSGSQSLTGGGTFGAGVNFTNLPGSSVVVGGALNLPSQFAVNGTLDLNGQSVAIDRLTGNGTVVGNGPGLTLTVGTNNGASTYGGLLQNGTGVLGLAKNGTGTLVLNGTNTAFSGGVTINSGVLQSGDNLLPWGTGTLTLNGGTFLRAAQNFATQNRANAYSNAVLVTSNSTIQTTTTSSRTVHFNSSFAANPGTTLVVTNSATNGLLFFRLYAGGLNYSGNLALGAFGTFGKTYLQLYNTNNPLGGSDQTFSGVISGSGVVYKNLEGSNPGGNVILSNGGNVYTGGTEIRGGFIGLGADNPLGSGNVTFGWDPNPIGLYAVGGARFLTNTIISDVANPTAVTAAGATNLQIKGSQDLTLSGRILIHTNVQYFTISNTALTTFSGEVTNAGTSSAGVFKQGPGTLVFSAANSYSGNTTVGAGILKLSGAGTVSASPSIAVNSGAIFDISSSSFALGAGQTLKGNGSVWGPLTVNGTLAPGASIGTLTLTNSPVLNGTIVMEINKTNGPATNDLLSVSGNPLAFGGTLIVTNTGGPLQLNDTFDLFDATAFSGAFAVTNLPSLPGGLAWSAQLGAGGSGAITVVCDGSLSAGVVVDQQITCTGANNGKATVTFAGNGGPFELQLDGGAFVPRTSPFQFTGLLPGSHTVTVRDANGCTASSGAFNILEPSVLTVSAGTNHLICAGGAVVLGGSPTASGGTAGYSYLWNNAASLSSATVANPTATPTNTTTYTLTVTDANGCSATTNVTVVVSPAPLVSAGGNQSVCAGNETSPLGGSIGGSATSAVWSTTGTGSFLPNASTLNATYLPSPADAIAGTVNLTLTTIGQLTPCAAATASVVVTVLPCAPGFQPCWRGVAGSTFQSWNFGSSNNPAALPPDLSTNSYGTATGIMAVGGFSDGYINTDFFLGGAQGIWDLGQNGSMTCSVPNHPGASPGSYKYVQVVVTQFRDGLYDENASVNVTGATLLQSLQQVVATNNYGGQWIEAQTFWRLGPPAPASESIVITGGSGGSLLDQVVVETLAVDGLCPGDIVTSTDPGQCSKANVTWAVPIVDGCVITNVASTVSSGSTFAKGTNAVSLAVTDAFGALQTCNFNVVVLDTENPTISCPATVVVSTDAGVCVATGVALGAPVATNDNCGILTVTNTASASYNKGTNYVTWTVVDTSGNTASCVQQVVVLDTENPTLTCPADLVVAATPGSCGSVVTFAPLGNDNCPGVIVGSSPPSGSFFPVGLTTVTCVATDAVGNVSPPCTFTVRVDDRSGDVVAFQPCWRGSGGSTFQQWTFAVSNNPAALAPDLITNSYGSAAGSISLGSFSDGFIEADAFLGCRQGIWDLGHDGSLTLSVANTSSGSASSYKYVQVVVTEFRDALYAAPAAVSLAGGTLVATASAVVGTNNFGGEWRAQKTLWRLGSPCPAAETVVVTASTNGTLVDQVVVETLCVDVAVPADIVASADLGQCSKSNVTWMLPAADGCVITNVASTPASGSTLSVGTNVVAVVLTDGAGGTQTVNFNVVITDDQDPVAVCQNLTVALDAGGNAAIVPAQVDNGSSDNCSILNRYIAPSNFTCANLGGNLVTLTVVDGSGRTNTCTATVTVVDALRPSVTVDQGSDATLECPATLSFSAPTFTDNCSGSIIPAVSTTTNLVGCTNLITRTWTATDGSGNTTNRSQTLIVVDTTAPTATLGSLATCYPSVAAANQAALDATTALSDNCDAAPIKTIQVSATNGCATPIVVRVSDACGNFTDLTYSTRVDVSAPVISSLTATQGVRNVIQCATNVLQGVVQITVTAADNCVLAGAPVVTLTNGTGSQTLVCIATNGPIFAYAWSVAAGTSNGTWTAVVTASDSCNLSSATFTLCVNKTQITGNLALQNFSGAGTVPPHSRLATFVASGGVSTKTWSLLLTNVSSTNFTYTLTDVPGGTTLLSAKTSWNLRKRLAVSLNGSGQGIVNFTGTNFLRGGDLSGDNQVQIFDYSLLSANWFTANPVADLNGDGFVQLLDYSILSLNWFTAGDPP